MRGAVGENAIWLLGKLPTRRPEGTAKRVYWSCRSCFSPALTARNSPAAESAGAFALIGSSRSKAPSRAPKTRRRLLPGVCTAIRSPSPDQQDSTTPFSGESSSRTSLPAEDQIRGLRWYPLVKMSPPRENDTEPYSSDLRPLIDGL